MEITRDQKELLKETFKGFTLLTEKENTKYMTSNKNGLMIFIYEDDYSIQFSIVNRARTIKIEKPDYSKMNKNDIEIYEGYFYSRLAIFCKMVAEFLPGGIY